MLAYIIGKEQYYAVFSRLCCADPMLLISAFCRLRSNRLASSVT
jgi:hypothetical protein